MPSDLGLGRFFFKLSLQMSAIALAAFITGPTAFAQGGDKEGNTCKAAAQTAQMACNTLGSAGMDAAQGAMFEMMLNQAVGLAGQMANSGQNMNKQCQNQADLSKLMGLLNAAKAAACTAAMMKCKSSCEADGTANLNAANTARSNPSTMSEATRLDGIRNSVIKASAQRCASYRVNTVANMASALQHAANMMQNQNCANATAATGTSPTPFSFPTPSDCTDPNNQSLTCFCARPENASKAMCGGGNPGVTPGGVQAPPGGNPGGNVPYSPVDPTNPGATNPFDGLGGKGGAGGGDSQGSGGGGAPGGGGLSSLGGESTGAFGANGDRGSAIGGVSSGNNAGSGGHAGGGGGGGGSGGAGRSDDGGFLSKLNLKKLLPGDKYKNRGLAGMNGTAKDGITGPMGPSLWEKATRQYQEQIQKQNVITDR
ncbi:MAG TPA: hypothetical protein PLZ57_00405 [Pseudobdellovibrionaceae bacterium]|nr:hypothetical protein [Pseudobdellovibrionaceae bacterium]